MRLDRYIKISREANQSQILEKVNILQKAKLIVNVHIVLIYNIAAIVRDKLLRFAMCKPYYEALKFIPNDKLQLFVGIHTRRKNLSSFHTKRKSGHPISYKALRRTCVALLASLRFVVRKKDFFLQSERFIKIVALSHTTKRKIGITPKLMPHMQK